MADVIRHAELAEIRRDLLYLARRSAFGDQLRDVQVEPADDGDGGEFLRVLIELRDPHKIKYEDVAPLLASIEDAVLLKDDRFPSVRFPEAA